MYEDLRKAARDPVLEPSYLGEQHSRPDLVAVGNGGGDDLIDISVVHPLISQRSTTRTISLPSTMLRQTYRAKEEQHKQALNLQLGGAIVPIVFSATGAWEPRSHAYMRTLAMETSARGDNASSVHIAIFFQRYAMRLLTGSMEALITEHPLASN